MDDDRKATVSAMFLYIGFVLALKEFGFFGLSLDKTATSVLHIKMGFRDGRYPSAETPSVAD
jgi:hypothetical protein